MHLSRQDLLDINIESYFNDLIAKYLPEGYGFEWNMATNDAEVRIICKGWSSDYFNARGFLQYIMGLSDGLKYVVSVIEEIVIERRSK